MERHGPGRGRLNTYQGTITAHLCALYPELFPSDAETAQDDVGNGAGFSENGAANTDNGAPVRPEVVVEVVEVQNLEGPNVPSGVVLVNDPEPDRQNHDRPWKPINDDRASTFLRHAKAWTLCRTVASTEDLLRVPERRLWFAVIQHEAFAEDLADLIAAEISRAA